MVTAILDAHSRLTMASELYREEILIGRGDAWATASRVERMAGFVTAMIEQAEKAAPLRWGNKITTEALFFGASDARRQPELAVQQLIGRLPRVPVVYVLRDGRAAVASKLRRTDISLEKACGQWVRSIEIWNALTAQGWPMATVRFEELVRAPMPTVSALCADLGEDFEAAMLGATMSNLLLPEYRRHQIDAAAAETVDLPDAGMKAIADAMVLAGYTPA